MKKFVIEYVEIWGVIGGIVIASALAAWGFPKGIIPAPFIVLAAIFYHLLRKPQVCGTYDVHGETPGGKVYNGNLKIEEGREELLSCKWESREWASDAPDLIKGVGLRVGKALAFWFEYTDSKGHHTGVMLYKIMVDHLSGKCVEFGESNVGFEKSNKQ